VRPRGEELRSGELLFGPGTTITSTHIGVLASIGQREVRVHRRPRVALASSGDELALLDDFARVRAGHAIVSSTTYALPPLLSLAGADVDVLPIARDDLQTVSRTLRDAIANECDLLITTGGVSVGEHDYTRDALRVIGGEIDFWRARIRPGGPIGTGSIGNVRWLGLPGNPVSSMVTGLLFAWPVIRRMAGHADVHHLRLRVRMRDRVETAAPLTHFLRVVVNRTESGELEASLAGPQGSNLLRTLAHANALLIVPEDMNVVQAGEELDIIMLPEHSGTNQP
jgi:molybdopterin molybdotransferase